ncbi:MAG: DUF4153 domain-containing protein [Candidatus Peregrinibacteria bacterium]|nr:DUF4153 domain-containing protein [Candidatus Peregrinibacteria bacterium]
MRLLSLKKLSEELVAVIRRFPIALAFAVLGTLVAMWLIEGKEYFGSIYVPNIVTTSVLGFLLFVSIELYLERNRKWALPIRLAAGFFLLIYFLLLPVSYGGEEFGQILRSLLYGLAFLLALTFSPFTGEGEINGFWQHNKNLFVRFFSTALYMAVLFFGLGLAVVSINELFGVEMPHDIYFKLWVLIVGILATSFFLAGIPTNLASLDKDRSYPRGIEVFSQYILLPLFTLYFFILYSYTAKILITGEWPQGVISTLILVFSLLGLFTHFLLYPLQNDKKHAWVTRVSKVIHLTIIPMILVLFWAVWLRVSDYGITESRYYVIALGLWLMGISIYFSVSKAKNIKVITGSLFLVILLSSFGPWGALRISEVSQFARLSSILTEQGLLVDGKIVADKKIIPGNTAGQVHNIMRYLEQYHGLSKVQPWFEDRKLDELCRKKAYCLSKELISQDTFNSGGNRYEKYFQSAMKKGAAIEVAGYSYVVPTFQYWGYHKDEEYNVEGSLLIYEAEPWGRIEVDLSSFINGLEEDNGALPMEQMIIETERTKLILYSISVKNLHGEDQKVTQLTAALLIR